MLSSITGFLFTLAVFLHPIHVSVTEIEFDERDKALEIMMRVFIDDLELSLRNKLKQPDLDILEPQNGMTTDQMVDNYLMDHFGIMLDNKQQKTVYLGHEREAEAFIFYIEVRPVKKWKTIHIRNSLIQETHADQSNLVHVTVREEVRSLRLTREAPADKITFDF